MRCHCGYAFAKEMLAHLERESDAGDPPYEGYAVIRDADFRRFLNAVATAATSPGEHAAADVAEATQSLVGTMIRCPECGRMVLLEPGASQRRDYRPD